MEKSYRVKKEIDFQTIIKNKQSFANRNFVVYFKENDQNAHFHVGISVGKKVGNAVKRNRVKRLIRHSLYELRDEIKPTYDIILIARPSISDLSFDEVKKNTRHVLNLANLIK
ncbi:ribonuclease P protein component [Vagococcus silagei]|uniref:Ribonuclease P protein component n=1 Tax=Vagococcus silagei TaxID=2508885 RepID=A0A4S3B690_9ENTE|nr:ribonuclease P protein component [Vagococcus silagei]THB61887.1 ribonuclease P protein component [Vagococcus silagei]